MAKRAKKTDCSKPPCKTEGKCCDEKKKQVEKCCPGDKGCPDTQFESADALRSHAAVTKYHAERRSLSKKAKPQAGVTKPLSDAECYHKRKCVLHPYKDTEGEPSKCCKAQTGHHLVPDKALSRTGFCYDHGSALTVCVAGSGNRVGNHGRIHNRLCKKIRGSGSISFSAMLSAGVAAAKEVLKESDCDWKCLQQEVDKNHKDMGKDDRGKPRTDCQPLKDGSQIDRNCGISNPGTDQKLDDSFDTVTAYITGP